MFDEARVRLDRAKSAYLHAVRQIDASLKPIIAAHPEGLDDAKALQASYAELGFTPLDLKEGTQPEK